MLAENKDRKSQLFMLESVGMPLQDFFALMHAHGLTLCDDTPQDIKQDLDDVRKVLKKNAQK
jgi:hypothetical protein